MKDVSGCKTFPARKKRKKNKNYIFYFIQLGQVFTCT